MASKLCCKEDVLKYLVNQNRPYSASDIIQNLHNEFGRTAVQKALDELILDNKIREKVYGKQKVYTCLQNDEDGSFEIKFELKQLDSKIDETIKQLIQIERYLSETEMELKNIESHPTTNVAVAEKLRLEKLVKEMHEELKSASLCKIQITEDEKNELDTAHNKLCGEKRKRKRLCMDVINSILENYPKKLQTLFEEIGIETDDIHNA